MILVKSDHPYLRVGHHRWYQSFRGVIYHVRGKLVVFKLCNYDKGMV
jgi:hypothetical protein